MVTNIQIISFIFLVISTFFFAYYIPYNIESKIRDTQKLLSRNVHIFELLFHDYREFQRHDVSGIIVRNSIDILTLSYALTAVEDINISIESRTKEMLTAIRSALICLSPNLGRTDTIVKKWSELDYKELQKEKGVWLGKWGLKLQKNISEKQAFLDTITQHEKEKNRCSALAIIFQVVGLLLSVFS